MGVCCASASQIGRGSNKPPRMTHVASRANSAKQRDEDNDRIYILLVNPGITGNHRSYDRK